MVFFYWGLVGENKMEEIKLNLENLSEEEREQLMKLVEKANKPKAGRWKPETYNTYWFISLLTASGISRSSWRGDSFDNARFSVGTVFKTEKDAKFALEKRKVEVELQDIADELNDGWKPDWTNGEQDKYFLYYDCRAKCFRFSTNEIFKNPVVYFKTESMAKEAIKRIGEERLKKYYFDVE